MIYLDSAATSLWHPKEAEERMIQALRGCGNAGRGAHDATLDAATAQHLIAESLTNGWI